MIVEKTENPNDIVAILKIPDNRLEKQFPCTKLEWVQWLIGMVAKENAIGIWVVREIESGAMLGYVVAVNSIAPPISDSAMILYSNICFVESEDANRLAVEKIKEWSQEIGAKKLILFTDHPDLSRKYGFVDIKGVIAMTMELDKNE